MGFHLFAVYLLLLQWSISAIGYECPAGYDCLSQQFCKDTAIECEAGTYCDGTFFSARMCPRGTYCETPAESVECPEGYQCRTASLSPKKCSAISICPAGGYKQRNFIHLLVGLIVLFISVNAWLTLRLRKMFKDRRLHQIQEIELTTTGRKSFQIQIQPREKEGNLINLRFEDLGLNIKAKKEQKIIIEGVTGNFPAGKVSAIMGPSGSGKTTLMNILCGKVKHTSGHVYVNGKEQSMSNFRKIVGYVPQDDNFLRTLTVSEVLRHSARIKLPYDWTDRKKMKLVDDVISLLKLDHVKNSVVGDEAERGISGGERKRVNIGIELVGDPSILFLDEPTSGLDSSTSKEIMEFLRAIAGRGMNVIAVIHQPRFEILQLCDQLLLLCKGGKTAFRGTTEEALTYFNCLGYRCPGYMNPADHFIDVISGRVQRRKDFAREESDMEAPVDLSLAQEEASKLPELWIENGSKFVNLNTEENLLPSGDETERKVARRQTAGFFTQYFLYLYRSLLQQMRDLKGLVIELCYNIIPGVALGTTGLQGEVYQPPLPLGLAELCPSVVKERCINETTTGDLPTLLFFVVMVIGAAANIIGTKTFGEARERRNYYREASSGANTFAYFLARCTFDLFNILKTSYIFLIFYALMTDPPGQKGPWFATVYLLYFAGFGMGYFFSSILEFNKALVSSVVAAIAISVTSGLSPTLSRVEDYWPLPILWYLSYCRWSAEAFYINMTQSDPRIKDRYDTVIRGTGYNPDNFALDLGMLFVLGVVWRILAYIAMRLRHRDKQK
eukprot:TRINITY_DN4868_c0_g1_i1.p1 TRINITY_DN4868_c0_g1~~TRINITY_DN4868_c0_g1_i1.p1  ORF type:complete len:808 (+),score=142.72 TRINITY_DN4868_c0_g1_i1:71-2425(+)